MVNLREKKINEHQKNRCRRNIKLHTKNILLQSMVFLLCVVGGTYAIQKRKIPVSLVFTPFGAFSCLKLAKNKIKQNYWKNLLKDLERS